jgi:hypothetical protein
MRGRRRASRFGTPLAPFGAPEHCPNVMHAHPLTRTPPKDPTITLRIDLVDSIICNATRVRRHGYQLRCLEPDDHTGDHQWTPELVDRGQPVRRST